jgi:hypothetical protein
MGIHYPTQAKVRLEWGTQPPFVKERRMECQRHKPPQEIGAMGHPALCVDLRMVGIVGSLSF